MYEDTASRKRRSTSSGWILIAQFQVFHDVREVNAFSPTRREDRVDQLCDQFVEVGRNGTRRGCGEGCNVPRGESVQVPFRRTHDELSSGKSLANAEPRAACSIFPVGIKATTAMVTPPDDQVARRAAPLRPLTSARRILRARRVALARNGQASPFRTTPLTGPGVFPGRAP